MSINLNISLITHFKIEQLNYINISIYGTFQNINKLIYEHFNL